MSFLHYGSMVIRYITRDAWMPKMRSHEISLALDTRIRELGGDIWYLSPAEKILTDDENRIRAVRLSDGTEMCIRDSFNRITRLSIPQYTNLVRLSNAKEMLSSPEKCSLLQIGTAKRLQQRLHFDKIFRSVEHMSPREYRNLIFK